MQLNCGRCGSYIIGLAFGPGDRLPGNRQCLVGVAKQQGRGGEGREGLALRANPGSDFDFLLVADISPVPTTDYR